MGVYTKEGDSLQQIGGVCPDGWVAMQGQRPTPNHVALADGTWFLDQVAIARAEFKAQREVAVANIKVTSSLGRTFDGGETDTTRMLKPIEVLKYEPEGTTQPWVLADSTWADVALPEFIEVLKLAGTEQTKLWGQPSPSTSAGGADV